MDHQLVDPLSLDNPMAVDFGQPDDTVEGVPGISMDSGDHVEIPMEFDHIEEKEMSMETCNEEIVDLMGDQFTLNAESEYTLENSQILEMETSKSSSSLISSNTMMELPFETQTVKTVSTCNTTQKVTTLKTAQRATASLPRHIAIAPKPPPAKPTFTIGKQYAIAPKPLTIKNPGAVKKVSLTSMLGQKTGQTLLAQIGKDLVMMPASSTSKYKLASGQGIQGQLVTSKNPMGAQLAKKTVMTKVVVQKQQNAIVSEQPAVITKIAPTGSMASPRFVAMHQKTVPISIDDKQFILSSPTKQVLRCAKPKQHIVSLQASPTKVLQAPAKAVPSQKLVLTNQQRLVFKPAAVQQKGVQLIKTENSIGNTPSGQRTQIHPINVPGKGIQYIRLVTNPTNTSKSKDGTTTTEPKVQNAGAPSKTIVLSDKKGNFLQMATDKVIRRQLPPVAIPSLKKVTTKSQQKLVRIAPVVVKPTQSISTQPTLSGQSLLAPNTSAAPSAMEEFTVLMPSEPEDTKSALRSLIENAGREEASEDDASFVTHEVEVEVGYQKEKSPVQENSSTVHKDQVTCKIEEHPLIVIPSNYVDEQDQSTFGERNEQSNYGDQQDDSSNMEQDNQPKEYINTNPFQSDDQLQFDYSGYQPPSSPPHLSDNELDNRPRKACNCTKSQCLKLYCDCFANGEFCNRCNCTNCHNNLENEELRQKAIRGCLDRNPNAFRPKIGKTRSSGPETIRRHNKGCNCKRSGCLKNYCECYEAKIACTAICKCIGCRNVEDSLERMLRHDTSKQREPPMLARVSQTTRQPCSFMTTEVIEAVCQCLVAAAVEDAPADPVAGVIEEFARCLQDIIGASHQPTALQLLDDSNM